MNHIEAQYWLKHFIVGEALATVAFVIAQSPAAKAFAAIMLVALAFMVLSSVIENEVS